MVSNEPETLDPQGVDLLEEFNAWTAQDEKDERASQARAREAYLDVLRRADSPQDVFHRP